MFWHASDDPDSDWRASVAGDRAHRHAQRVPVSFAAGAGGAEARSAERSSVLLSGTQGRSLEGDLARWPGRVPVHETAGAGPIPVAEPGRRRGYDLVCATRLSSIRNRLAAPAGNLASDKRRVTI